MNKGWIKIHRKLFDSEIWIEKPSTWKVIWLYILQKVNHEGKGRFNRGEAHFIFSQELPRIGKDITENNIKRALQFMRKRNMIRTRRSTRGTIVTVLKYNEYQDKEKHEARDQFLSTHDASTPINKNVRIKEYRGEVNLEKKRNDYKKKYGVQPLY